MSSNNNNHNNNHNNHNNSNQNPPPGSGSGQNNQWNHQRSSSATSSSDQQHHHQHQHHHHQQQQQQQQRYPNQQNQRRNLPPQLDTASYHDQMQQQQQQHYDPYHQPPATAAPSGGAKYYRPPPSASIRPPMSARPGGPAGGFDMGGFTDSMRQMTLQQQDAHRPQSAGGFLQTGSTGGQFGSQATASYQQAFATGSRISMRPPGMGGSTSRIPPPIATGRNVTSNGPNSAAALEGVQFLWQAQSQQYQQPQSQQYPPSQNQQYQQQPQSQQYQPSQNQQYQQQLQSQQYQQQQNYTKIAPATATGTTFPYATLTPTTMGSGGAGFRGPQSAVLPGERTSYGLFSGLGPISLPYTAGDVTSSAMTPVSAVSPRSSSGTGALISMKFPHRPENGTRGRTIQVRANFFEFLTLPGQDVYHYDVRITPEVPPSLNRKIFRDLEAQCGAEKLGGIISVYDGRKNLYTPKELSLGEANVLEIDVIISDDEKLPPQQPPPGYTPRVFTVRIKKASIINMDQLSKFLNGQLAYTPLDALQAVDVLMRQRPSMLLTTVGRSFFTRNDAKLLGDGAECWMGFHQSVRPAKGKLLVNVDVSATAFYEPGPLLNFISRNLGKRNATELKAPLKSREIDKCERLLKGVKVVVTHRGDMRRKYKINGFTRIPAGETFFKFSRPTEGGETVEKDISVSEYFMAQYNIQLRFPFLPCLKVGSTQRTVFLPLEVCDIVPGQRYIRKLNEQQTAQMIRLTCQTPDRRASKIAHAIDELGLQASGAALPENDKDFLASFGVSVSDQMMTVPARILEPPTIQYHPTSREPLITPREGAWNLRDKKVVQPATLHSWAVVCFGSPRDMPQHKVDHFLREMISTCRDTGLMITNPHPPAIYCDPSGNIEATMHTAWQAAGEAVQSFPQLILCVLPNTGVPLYAEIKRVGDTVLGVPTQCVQAKHTFQPKKQYCANVCLKINAKLGGVNSFIVKNPSVVGDEGLPWVAQEPTIIFGADVTHPAHGEAKTSGSVCALVGSLDRQASRYAATVRLQPPRREIILELADMVTELLKIFYHENNQIAPQRIMFYRDGCSESLFHEVVSAELAAIRQACERLQQGYTPTITYVVVQKRHHARVFAVNPKDADRSGNIPAGTVIDSHITHPNEYDFFLCSHAGLQGTSRPTHYHVLHDENQFTPDALQELTYRLCYGYARCTRSVSVVPPAYYADLVAFRAKYHLRGFGGSMTGSASAREDGFSFPLDQKTISSVDEPPHSAAESEGTLESPGDGSSTTKKKKRQATKEEDELMMRRLQGRLAAVKPELQKVMYFM